MEGKDFVVETGKRGLEEDKLADALRNTNLIQIMQEYSNADTGVCVDMIKASVYEGADNLNEALEKFIAKVLAE